MNHKRLFNMDSRLFFINMEEILFNMLFEDNVTDYEFWRNASQWMI